MKISGSEVMFVVACILIALGLYFLYFVYRMYTGFRRLATEDKVKKVGGKHEFSIDNYETKEQYDNKIEDFKRTLNAQTKTYEVIPPLLPKTSENYSITFMNNAQKYMHKGDSYGTLPSGRLDESGVGNCVTDEDCIDVCNNYKGGPMYCGYRIDPAKKEFWEGIGLTVNDNNMIVDGICRLTDNRIYSQSLDNSGTIDKNCKLPTN